MDIAIRNNKLSRIMSLALAAMLIVFSCICSAPVPAEAAGDFVVDGTVLKAYKGSDKKVVVPAGIKTIGVEAFYGNTQVQEVVLPDGLTEINYGAFYSCTELKKINFPSSLTSIGDYCFSYCSSLTAVKLPDKLKTLGFNSFAGCTSLTKLTLGKNLTEIPADAFYGCKELSSITFGSKLESIGSQAFADTGIKKLTLPKSLISINEYAFAYCEKLETIKFNSKLRLIGPKAFNRTPWYSKLTYDSNGFVIKDNILFYAASSSYETKKVIPKGVKIIAGEAMAYSKVSEIEIPDTVIAIGPQAFNSCYYLDNVTVPSSVKYIGDKAFTGCTGLENIVLPSKLTYKGRDILPTKELELDKVTDKALKQITDYLKKGNSVTVILPSEYKNGLQPETQIFVSDLLKDIAKKSGLYCYLSYNNCRLDFVSRSINGSPSRLYCTLSATDYELSVAASDKIKKNAQTITLKSITSDNAAKIDNALKDNKSFILKLKTSEAQYNKKLNSLNSKLKEINKAGVIVPFTGSSNYYVSGDLKYTIVPVSKKGYNYLYISSETAKTYNYAVEFLNKIFDKAKKNAYSDSQYGSSYATAKKVLSNAKCMNDLSDAMKVYAVATSGYFRGQSTTTNNFCMVYDYKYSYVSRTYNKDSDRLKVLLDDKARGVCEDFAVYELVLWANLGIEAWYNSSNALEHAWSVVKVKNADGKVMWVPFDYDIGPAPNLSGSPYNSNDATQVAKRYKIYLNGIPGAPENKNFSAADFK